MSSEVSDLSSLRSFNTEWSEHGAPTNAASAALAACVNCGLAWQVRTSPCMAT